jgi:hypothetical protein
MDGNDLNISLLSFGDTGMEWVAGQTTDQLDEDHITLIGNFYANVLGAAQNSSGIFGPLPVAYRYDLLLFVFGFTSYDSTVKDQRVIDSNHQTRSSLLLFFPATLDSLLSENRILIRTNLIQWCKAYETAEIRSVKRSDLEKLVSEIVFLITSESSKKEMTHSKAHNLIKVAGRNFFLLETLGKGLKVQIIIKFISVNNSLGVVLRRSILQENIDILLNFNQKNFKTNYYMPHLHIEEIILSNSSIIENKFLKKRQDGVLLLTFLPSKNEKLIFESNISKILNESSRDSVVSICIDKKKKEKSIYLENTTIPQMLAKQTDRTISLVDLTKHNISIETAIIDFIEKIVSKFTSTA